MCEPMDTPQTTRQGMTAGAAKATPALVEQHQTTVSGPAQATPLPNKSEDAQQAWRQTRLRYPALGLCRR